MKRPSNLKKIDLEFRCGEDPRAMVDQDGNKFCQQCQKTVIDFTQWSEEEIINYFERNRGSTCGIFGQQQLAQLNTQLKASPPSRTHRIAASLLGGALAFGTSARAQESPSREEVVISQKVSPLEVVDSSPSTSKLPEFSSGYVIAKKDVNPSPGSNFFVSGTILDDKDEPQEGIAIRVYNHERVQGFSYSDKDGRFQLSIRRTGFVEEFSIQISQESFDTLTIPGAKVGNHDIKVFMARRDSPAQSLKNAQADPLTIVDKGLDTHSDSLYLFRGTLLDESTGVPLLGGIVQVFIEDRLVGGAYTDVEGKYEIPIEKSRGEIDNMYIKYSYLNYYDLTLLGSSHLNKHVQISLRIVEVELGSFDFLAGVVISPRHPLHKRILHTPRRIWWGIRRILSR